MEARDTNVRDGIGTILRNLVVDSHALMVHSPIISMPRRDNLAIRRAVVALTRPALFERITR